MRSMSKQVVYLINSPLSSRDFDRFGIQKWISRGWNVKVFDITKFIKPEFWMYVNGIQLSVDFDGLTIFDNIDEVLSILKSLENRVVFIDMIDFSNIEHKIRVSAFRRGVLIRRESQTIPVPFSYYKAEVIWKLPKLIKQPGILIAKIIKRIRIKRYTPNYRVVAGTISMVGINDKESSIIKAHNLDYDFFIQEEEIDLSQNDSYILFLDQHGGYHSDFVHDNVKQYVTPNNYYPAIDSGLSRMAESLGLNVKVAEHPRSFYKANQIKYKHPMIKGNTFKLIRKAEVVVAHDSTALNWAIVMKKPIIFATTDEIQNTPTSAEHANFINNWAATLGKNVVNMDQISKINNWDPYLDVDEKIYEKYINTYITQIEKQKTMYWDVVIDRIESDLFQK